MRRYYKKRYDDFKSDVDRNGCELITLRFNNKGINIKIANKLGGGMGKRERDIPQRLAKPDTSCWLNLFTTPFTLFKTTT